MMSKVQGGEMLKGTHCIARMIKLASGWSRLLPTHLATLRSLSHSPRTLASGWSRLLPMHPKTLCSLSHSLRYVRIRVIHTKKLTTCDLPANFTPIPLCSKPRPTLKRHPSTQEATPKFTLRFGTVTESH